MPPNLKEPRAKRAFDLIAASSALSVTWPLLLLGALAVKLEDGGPIFYHAVRVGRGQRLFKMVKLRSMQVNADQKGPQVTRAGDARITRVGALLRRTKIDELAQLWNVLKGDMSMIGPRPESPHYVQHYRSEWAPIFDVRPGVIDPATLEFVDEERLLAQAGELEHFYLQEILPRKITRSLQALQQASLTHDAAILISGASLVTRRFLKACLATLHSNKRAP